MRTLIEAIDQRVLLTDGAPARQLRARDLDVERDLFSAEDCVDMLNITRASVVRDLHTAYLRAGADVIRTNTLAASPLALQRWGLGDHAFYVNFAAAQIACEAVDAVPGRGRRRFVLGIVRDLGWDEPPREIEQAVSLQVEALFAGGVDGIAIDITPGAGRSPAFLRGAKKAQAALQARAPIFLLRGDGVQEFSEHARALADAVVRYRHGSRARDGWLRRAIEQDKVNLIGGGASPDETRALDRLLRVEAEDGLRPLTPWRRPGVVDEVVPASSSLYVDPALAELH